MVSTTNADFHDDRLLVSVLYVDILGFSALADILSPAQLISQLPDFWNSLEQVVEEYGGMIDKQMVDSLLVIWGAPESLEDDAERAISAGMEILKAFEDIKGMFDHTSGKALRLRMGIHTGLALAGKIGLHGEYSVIGDTVTFAKHLGEIADPGSLFISESTYQAIRGAFKVKRLTPMQFEGTNQLVNLYQILGELPQPTKLRYRSKGGLETHLVGRDDEMAKLETIYQQVSETNKPQMVLVTGDIGVGKSRLIFEFAGKLETENPLLTVMSSRALDQTSQVPYYIWKELWSNRFELNDDDPPELSCSKTIDGVLTLWGKELGEVTAIEVAHFLGSLIGVEWEKSTYLDPYLDKPDERTQRAFSLLEELFFRASVRGPVVLILDDLQWADGGSLKLITRLLNSIKRNIPLLILCCARTDFIQNGGVDFQDAVNIHLEPLPVSIDIVRRAYPVIKDAPDDLLTALAERAEGNPYFMEEIVKNVLSSESWDLADYRHIDHLPETLADLLHSRLDSLSLEGRATAYFAAVAGRVFWKGAVLTAFRKSPKVTKALSVTGHNLVGKVQNALDELMEKELAFLRVGSAFSGEREYIFKHSLLREVAYHRLPPEYRHECHKAVADWLAERIGPERSVCVAYHYESAGMNDLAQEYYTKAADHARTIGQTDEADDIQYHARTLPDHPQY
jgi:class 3 adenylate cyclase